jgi:AGZA family xanthine/uracil permease-like MFS transporter
MKGTRARLERYFEFQRLGTNWRTEILAGVTTFMTMAYIVFVNPSILHEAGMPLAAVTAATCLSAAFGSILMGAVARYPLALAPGMGLNAYFTYSVVKAMGVTWQTALGAVFISGVTFLILTLVGVRRLIVSAIPHELYAAVAAGVGLFIALIGFRSSGIIIPSAATTVAMGNLRDPHTALAICGLLFMAALLAWEVRAAILIGVLGTTVAGVLFGLVHWQPQRYGFSDLSATVLQLDIRSAMRLGLVEIVFAFLFVDLFDNVGTLVAVGQKAGLFDRAHQIPRINRILLADASATIAGSLAGTSTVVSYIESSAGVAAGGRTGITAIDRTAVPGRTVARAPGGSDSCGGNGARAHYRRQHDDDDDHRDPLDGFRSGHPRISDHDGDSADVQHRQRTGVRVHSVHSVEGAARPIPGGELVGVRADAAVYRAVRVFGQVEQ